MKTFILAEATQYEGGNRFDHYLYQDSLYFVVFLILALLGLLIGWLMWRNCKARCLEIEAENGRLEAEFNRKQQD